MWSVVYSSKCEKGQFCFKKRRNYELPRVYHFITNQTNYMLQPHVVNHHKLFQRKKCTHSQYNCNKSCERGKDLDDKLMLNYDSDKKARREGAGKKCEKEREKKKPGEADLPLVTRTRSKKTQEQDILASAIDLVVG